MRPEISEIVREIYPELKDDTCVRRRPSIKGLTTNSFFFSH